MRKQIYNGNEVVVVGAGNAALTAALAAQSAGAKTIVLEKATKYLRGGNTRFSGGLFRSVYRGVDDLIPIVRGDDDPRTVIIEPYSREDFIKDLERTSGRRADQTLSEVLVDRSYETVRWMSGLGVPWEFNRGVGAVTIPGSDRVKVPFGTALRTKGEGVGLSESLFRRVREVGIRVLYETQGLRIVKARGGGVTGIEGRCRQGSCLINCRAIVLASGGFQADPAMRATYLGREWKKVKVRGTRFNTGDMINAVLDINGQSYGEWEGCHATPIDADAPEYGLLRLTDKTNRLSYPFSIMVNLDGERFTDEGEDYNLYTYARTGAEILKQRDAVALQIFDRKTVGLLEPRYSTGTPMVAGTIQELADRIGDRYKDQGFQKDTFLKTVEGYNVAVKEGSFDPESRDGKRTEGLHPDKTNWALRIDEAPYYAYAATVGITFTYGGIRINTDAAVVDQGGRPIPGLYSTGEMAGGFFYGNYPGGAGLTRGAVFGRLAGEHAAQFAHG